jgi:DNA-binding response OmpR family regulator
MKKILIIEDDEIVSGILFETLSKTGYSVTKTIDALQGHQAVISMKPDLIILDLMLPAGHGLNLLKDLRHSALTQGIPVIIATSYEGEEAQGEAEALGIQAYVKKPFNPDQMVATVNQILG